MAFRWRANDDPSLNLTWKFCDFQGIRTSIAKKPFIFVIFQGDLDPLPSSESAHEDHVAIETREANTFISFRYQ